MQIVLIVNDIRSCHNVGSLIRTAEGLDVSHIYFTGYSPYPTTDTDDRLPHIRDKLSGQIHKTALGTEDNIDWSHHDNVFELINTLKSEGYKIIGLEYTGSSVPMDSFTFPGKTVVIIGREVLGLSEELQNASDVLVHIPMLGQHSSFNVVQATAMCLYQCRYKN